VRARYLEHLDAAFCIELFFSEWEAEALARALAPAAADGRFAWVLGNHDFSRIATRLGPQHARAAATLLLTLPGAAFIYQGDEVGQQDGPDRGEDRAGRDPFRAPVPWDEVAAQREDPGSLLRHHRDLIALRRRLEGPVEDLTAREGVLTFRRGAHRVEIDTVSGAADVAMVS
jgi:alpha-glucosidase